MSDIDFDPFAGGEILRVSPTTAPQQEIITSSKMSDEANTAFNEAVSLTIVGSIDIKLLEKCCNILIERHDILRATFSPLGDELCLQDVRDISIDVEDLRHYDETVQQQLIENLFTNIAISPMNLEEGPLLYVWLKQLQSERFELTIAAHHVVCDGWSTGLLLTELAELYRNGGDVNVLDAAPSYFDFADQQEASQITNVDVDYWVDQFQDLPPTLDLPLDFPRPPLRSFRAARYDYQLDSSLVAALPKVAATLKSSLVNYVLAGYFALLYRLTCNNSIVVGLPVAGQAALNRLGLVGHAVQLLPVRIHLDSDTTFTDLVSAVKGQVLNASEYPNFTFGQLLKKIAIERSRVPLVNTIFNIDQPMPALDFGSASASVCTVPRAAESFEMFLNIVPSNDGLVIEATYSTALFSEGTIISWMQTLEEILRVAVKTPGTAIGDHPLSSDIPQVLQRNNQTARSRQFTDLMAAFKSQVQQRPNAIAVIAESTQLSYQELDVLSSHFACSLVKAGVEKNSVVGICCERTEFLLVGTLAILSLGATYLPLDPDFPPERLLYMLEDSGAVAILEDASAPQAVQSADLTHLTITDLVSDAEGNTSLALAEPCAERAAYTIYTSGSTGKPKGVRVQHSAMINFLESMANEPGCKENDVLLAVTTLSFDISVLELFLPLVVGATTLIASREDVKDGDRLANLLQQHNVTVMQATPGTWRMLLASEWAKRKTGASYFKALCGGEPLPQDLVTDLLPCVKELWNMFGPTETTIWSSCKHVQPNDPLITVGKPIVNTQLYLLDECLNPLPVSVPGELFIGGDGVTLGYHERPELNKERFIEHPKFGRIYRTGDLAKVLPNGDIQHLGRLDDQVKLRGYRIELGEIETALVKCAEVKQAAVYLWRLSEQDVRVVACCVPAADKALETINIRKQLRESLPGYMIPQYFLSIDTIPLTPNGKVDRRALPHPEMGESSILGEKVLQTDMEKLIAQVWVDLLNINGAIGREDNFFELGGHSLLALEAIRRIETISGERLKPAEIVSGRLATLAEKVSSASSSQQERVATPKALSPSVPRQLSSQQLRLLERQLKLPDSTCNNLPAAWLLEGEMDLTEFSQSITRVVERQTALRTIITPDEEGYQLVLRHVSELDLPDYKDFSNTADPMAFALADARQCVLQPFSVVNQALCNILLYKITTDKHLLVINSHQLIFDGWSFDIFLTELEAYYQAALDHRAVTLNPLPFQFRDYTQWHASQPPDNTNLLYHRRVIESDCRASGLINIDAEKGKYCRRELYFGGDILQKLDTFCERYQVRFHEVLLTLFAKACTDIEQRNQLMIGMPVTGRYMPEVIGLVGSFVSTLPLELNVCVGNFNRIVQDIAEQLRVFHEHQELSFAELVVGTPLVSQLFPGCLPISFAFQDIRNRPQSLANLKLSQIDMDRLQTEVPIEFWTRVQLDGFVMVFDYDSGQVETATIDKLAVAVSTLASTLDQQSDAPLTETSEDSAELIKRPLWRRLFQ